MSSMKTVRQYSIDNNIPLRDVYRMIDRGELKTERKPMKPREITYIIEEEN